MEVGDRVIWKGANPDGWAGNGRARILDYNEDAPYFSGGKRRPPNERPTGPAILILIDQGNVADPKIKKFDVWCRPDEVRPDPEPLIT
jgi:hypothetical protein